MGPDMALGRSQGLDITVVLGGKQDTHLTLFTTLIISHLPLSFFHTLPYIVLTIIVPDHPVPQGAQQNLVYSFPPRMESPKWACGSSSPNGLVVFSLCCPRQRAQELFKLNYKIIASCTFFLLDWLKEKESVNKTKHWQRRRAKGTLIHGKSGCDIEQPLWRSLAVTYEVKIYEHIIQ